MQVQLAAAGNSSAGAAPSPRLVNAAHEFEAQMMKELLKPLTSAEGTVDGSSDSEPGSNGALGEFAAEALGRGLSVQGGLGIAKGILKELTPHGNQTQTAGVTRNGYLDTVMRSAK